MAYKYPYDDYDQYEKKEYKPYELQTNRSMWKLVLLEFLTFGIYGIIFFIPFSFDLDKIAPKRDHTKTMNYLWAHILAIFTMNIVIDIWHYGIACRVEEALERRNIDYNFGTTDFWKWFILGSFVLVGPFVYLHKLCTAMNLLCDSYNKNPTQLEY